MRSPTLLLATILLAGSALAAAAQTTVQRSRGSDERGRYDITWVRLTDRVGTPASRARINADLEREARSHICEPDRERRADLDAWFEMEVTHLGPRLLAVATREETFCGGAYPNHGPGGLLYDIRTGARIELEEQMADPRAFRRFVARRALAAAPKDAGECADEYTGERLAGTGFIYVLNARSLTAIPDYPHVILACGFDTAISFTDVVRFAKPGSPLRSLGQR